MIFADAVTGWRLLSLARRTRQLPELCLGASLLLFGVAGYPLAIAARRGIGGSEALSGALLLLALTIQNAACLFVYVANWRVFRRDARWAAALVGCAAVAFTASLVGQAAGVGFPS